ncbi:hypothetical protein [Oceanirhabdus sp. W0125-5]|uniref:hypothetical protein n=1 Tax=Oceanirhabdus sp. W0125-5 TaxID=2999116 RepID=UPI0022F2D1ED|nr:hypothetical protein [Oceanirhabdus sp. W0125-5]WBW95124.1 hypothetical protein OW730_15675 [Oceanirhabdus sp. W0125-5]
MKELNKSKEKESYHNKSIRVNVSVFGVILSISGMVHGLFEILQGNVKTEGLMIHAIGEAHKFWVYGNEPAFTIIPNYLITGLVAIFTSLIIIIWSVKFMDKKNSPHILLMLFIVLLLVGGGVGQAVFFTVIWIFATRITKPLSWWDKVISSSAKVSLSKLWLGLLLSSSVLVFFALEIAVFGYVPSIQDTDIVSLVMLSSLGSGFILLIVAFISGICRDLVDRKQ